MGSVHDIMQTFAIRDLHTQFPDYDGWQCNIIPDEKSGNRMYRVSRYYHSDRQETILAVSFDPKPSADSIAALPPDTTDNQRYTRQYLLVPQGADVSGIPEGIGILTMTSFGFSNGNLVWLTKKKNAMRYPPKEGAQT